MKDLTLFTEYEVSSAETDMDGRLRLSAFVNLLIQSAIKSADLLGFGWADMTKHHLFWVLSRLHLNIDAVPKWYDKIIVETWPKDIYKILYLRDFIVRNENNDIIASATSAWFALDDKSRRPRHVNTADMDKFILLKDKHAINEIPEKLPPVADGNVFALTPEYFDVDVNKHITSTRYIDWMMNTFSIDFHNKHYPKELTIDYLKEIRLGSDISITKKEISSVEYLFEGYNKTQDVTAFRGKIIF